MPCHVPTRAIFMILSYSWLKEMVELPVTADELAEVLTFLGLEVEEVKRYKPALDKVVIGEVLESAHIEGTDHLSITKTAIAMGEVVSIVCGAPNVRAGLKVPVMLPGSVTADGMTIKKAKLKGHESLGMLASERELGLVEEHAGIIEGDAAWVVGAAAAQYIALDDTTYDVEITPNRPDFLSHVGVARDLAAKFRIPWRWPEYPLTEIATPASQTIGVRIDAPEGCPRYAARLLRGITIQPSPYALRLRLMRCGTRPISNIVDVTNYLMLEFGQPLHAFDLRFVDHGQIVVRYAGAGEKFVTLDGKEHELQPRDLLIADPAKGIALAGIMGGLNSEIRDDTQDVLIECAYFDPVHVRRTRGRLGIGTESSRRFERGMDPNGVPRVLDATAAMMQRLAGGEVHAGRVDSYPRPISPNSVCFRPARATHVIGTDIPVPDMEQILSRLGCEIAANGDTWQLQTPTWRPDLEREIDLVEEVVRVYGYDQIPTGLTSRVPLSGRDNPLITLKTTVVDAMVALGFHETLSLSMYTPDERRDPPDMPPGIELKNPVTDDMLRLQGSLVPQLVRSAAGNWQRGDRNLRLFEVARVFAPGKADDPRTWERQTLTAVMTGQSYPQVWSHPAKPFDFYDLKGVIEVLATKISLDNLEINCYDVESGEVLKGEVLASGAVIGKWTVWPTEIMARSDIDAPLGWFELDLEDVLRQRQAEPQYLPLPRFPLSWRDLALVADESLSAAELQATIRQHGGPYLVKVEPFDIFRGEKLGVGKKSIAFRLEFSHSERSLESDEVDGWVKDVMSGLTAAHGVNLR
jgi:phenylalanyl-tRNA synthetase beta chain